MQRSRLRRRFTFPVSHICMFHFHSNRLASLITLMRLSLIGLIIPTSLLIGSPASAQGIVLPLIISPTTGQVLQGQVAITGTTDIPNFGSAELDFGYSDDTTNTRLLIQMMTESIANNVLGTWDTTSISDGDYYLLLRVNLTDGSFQEVKLPVKVRNYTTLPTPTATILPTLPALQIPTPILIAPTATPTLAPLPTPTSLSPNPISTGENEVYIEFWRGGLIVLFLFLVFGLAIRIRRS